MEQVFPDKHWKCRDPEDLGLSKARLDDITRWLQGQAGDKRYRVAVIRGGYLVAEWEKNETKQK